jgi:diguanylate cyclase (GGDEF)-like protein/PAS domain S-box-containing protein
MLSQKKLSLITEHFPGIVAMYNIKTGDYLYVNNSVKKILGYSPDDFLNGGYTFATSILHPDDIDGILEANQRAITKSNKDRNMDDGSPIVTFEYRMRHKNGKWKWLFTEGTVLKRDKNGNAELVLNISIDITKLKEKEKKLYDLNLELSTIQENARGFRSFIQVVKDYAIFRLDSEGKIITWNDGIRHIFGYEENEIIGKHFSIFFSPNDLRKGVPEKLLEKARTDGTTTEEGLRIKKDGTNFFASVTSTTILGENNELQGYSQIIRDITEKKEAEETIRFHAYHDVLTGLMNRKALDEHFTFSKSLMENQRIAVLFLDLDRFKTINDTLGHLIGDQILKEAANRIQTSIGPKDVLARLGGDEFVILLQDISSIDEIIKIAENILQAFVPTMHIPNQVLHLSASIGIAVYPEDGIDIYNLLKNADTALYRAKDAGRNRFQFYDVSMNLHSYARLALENDLRLAINNNEIIFHYQPIVDKNKKLIGTEALTRWNHPLHGLLQPGEFIGLAEEVGLIGILGKEGNKKVWKQFKAWKDQHDACCRISMNISSKHFENSNFIKELKMTLDEYELSPKDIELEITESIAMNHSDTTNNKLNELKEMGVAISIDDFGTGYSSLSYLKSFPINRLKIDKSFIRHCISNFQDQSIIKAIIAVGHSLGFEVIGEGVETEEQFDFLISEGCDGFQGYLFDKPLHPNEYSKWFATQNI